MRYFRDCDFRSYSAWEPSGRCGFCQEGSRMARLTFLDAEREALRRERFEHPHPRVQKRMDVLWYISKGETYSRAAELGDVSPATVDRYVAIYRQRGIEGLKQFD